MDKEMSLIMKRAKDFFLKNDVKGRDEAIREVLHMIMEEPALMNKDFDTIEREARRISLKIRGNFGILDPLIEDESVNEIMVNGKDDIFYEKGGRIARYDLVFDTVEELEEVIRSIAGQVHREINELNPIVDARLPDGSRVSGVYKNVAVNGPILTIRKFSESFITIEDLISNGTVKEDEAEFLKALVICGYNLFISGGTSSGKTTLLNALSDFIPEEERVIVIEDSMELKLSHISNIVHMECRNANSQGKGMVTMADLIKASLRMRPDRIIVGEVRGGEVAEMLQAMNTGHPGSMSTGHGNTCEGMLKRLESMYLMAIPLDVNAIRAQIAEGIDIMIHVVRDKEGKRRISEMKELLGYENGSFILIDVKKDGILKLNDLRKAKQKGDKYERILGHKPDSFSHDWFPVF